MSSSLPDGNLQVVSTASNDGKIELSLQRVPVSAPQGQQVMIRVEAAPINPSDLGPMLGPGDVSLMSVTGEGQGTVASLPVPEGKRSALAPRLGKPMPTGHEGSGVVVATGEDPAARSLLGKVVAATGAGMYAEYRTARATDCLVLPDGTDPVDCSSCFVNPLTVLGMLETAKREGHSAIVNTAAASQLGQMLNRVCLKDGISLVNVVRRPEQAELLRGMGATHVCDTSSPDFMTELTDAVADTGATIGFDATGGGPLAGQLLKAMEAAARRSFGEVKRYGSDVYKQVYLYGGLDPTPTFFSKSDFGASWGIGEWRLTPYLQKIGADVSNALRARVAAEIKTTFKTTYAREIPLIGLLDPEEIRVYSKRSTSAKYLVRPDIPG